MEKQTVYTTLAMEGSPLDKKIQEMVKYARLEKHENVYVFTSQEFEKLIGDAIDFGKTYKAQYEPNSKTEYLNNLK